MLSYDELRAEVEAGAIDTVVVAFTDMQGRLMGKRLQAEFFLEEMDAGHGVEGCNYLLALEMEMDPVPGYALASWEQGYGDFDVRPDLATLRRIPWLEATALVLGDVQWHDGTPVQPSPRQVLKAQLERAAALGFTPMMGSELEFYLLRETFEEAHKKEYSGPDAVGAVHPRLPHPRDDLRRGVPAPDPERDAGGRHARRDVEGRGVAGPAGDQLPLRRRADDGGQPRDLQERRQGDRVPQRVLDHVHGEALPGLDRQLLSHPLLAVARRRGVLRDRRGALLALARRADRMLQGARGVPRADDQLVQAVRRRLLGADDARVGERQPHLWVQGRRPRCGAPGRDANPGRRREPVPRVRGGDRRGAARDRARARAAARPRGQRVRVGCRSLPVDDGRGDRRARETARWRGARSATQVVDHYLNYARTEQGLYDAFVTDWERKRYYERG